MFVVSNQRLRKKNLDCEALDNKISNWAFLDLIILEVFSIISLEISETCGTIYFVICFLMAFFLCDDQGI